MLADTQSIRFHFIEITRAAECKTDWRWVGRKVGQPLSSAKETDRSQRTPIRGAARSRAGCSNPPARLEAKLA